MELIQTANDDVAIKNYFPEEFLINEKMLKWKWWLQNVLYFL